MNSTKLCRLFVLALWTAVPLCDARAGESRPFAVSANACDDVKEGYDKQTAEYRAVDLASLQAVKTSGLIQSQQIKMLPAALDVVAYRIIDEYLFNVKHEITHSDAKRVCVHVSADIEITDDELQALIKEHKEEMAEQADPVQAAEKTENAFSLKPQSPEEKKLLYIDNMKFWDGTENNHYKEFLTELFSQSDYFYVTENKEIADVVVTPWLRKGEVENLDGRNYKMQMLAELTVESSHFADFPLISDKQNHFILFGEDKNEQEVADTLLRKLLTRSATAVNGKIDSYFEKSLENSKFPAKK